jgi:hypothetical protein
MRWCWLVLVIGALTVILVTGCSPQQFCWEIDPVDPVTVGSADIYEDGGTAVVVFTDARGCEYEICLDNREGPDPAPRCLYISAKYPTDERARRLDPNSDHGLAIHHSLQRWYEAHYSPEKRSQLESAATVVGLSEMDVMALRVQAVLRGFRRGACSERAAPN